MKKRKGNFQLGGDGCEIFLDQEGGQGDRVSSMNPREPGKVNWGKREKRGGGASARKAINQRMLRLAHSLRKTGLKQTKKKREGQIINRERKGHAFRRCSVDEQSLRRAVTERDRERRSTKGLPQAVVELNLHTDLGEKTFRPFSVAFVLKGLSRGDG